MVAPRLGTQSRLFPARGRAWGPSPDRCLGDDSLAHCLLDRASARPWLSHQSLALKGSSYLWAELAARSRTENLRPGAGGTSNSWGTRVHRPSRQEHTHSPGSIPKSTRTSFPERRTGETCTTLACDLLRP